jgi:PAS domain S-box-containing protein
MTRSRSTSGRARPRSRTAPATGPARLVEPLAETIDDAYRAGFEHAVIGVAFADREANFVAVNPRFAAILGYEPGELQGRSFRDVTHAEDLAASREQVRRLRDDRTAPGFSLEKRYIRKDGSLLWGHVTSSTVRDAAGQLRFVVVTLEDVTEQRRVREALGEAQRVVESSPAVAFRWEPRPGWPVSLVSDNVRRFGWAPEDLLSGRVPFVRLIHPDDLERVVGEVQRYVAEGREWFAQEYRVVTPSGEVRWVDDRTTVERAPDGSVRVLQGVLLDITDRRLAEQEQARLREQLQQAMKMEAIGRLAGGVAHDFNNLLTAIIGNADLALLDLGPEHPLRAPLEEVLRASSRAAELTRQLLAFGRRQVIAPRALDLNAVVENLHRMLTRVLGEDIDLQTSLARPLGAVRADPGQVEQCLINLAINARDAMPAGGRLRLTTTERELDETACRGLPTLRPGPHVVLSVADDGVGMTPEVQAHAFEPFFTTKPAGSGTGLGLASVFGVMQQHQGSVALESAPGRGTTVSLFFPRAAAEAPAAGAVRSDARLPAGSETVLLVEDDEHVRELTRHLLRRLGYQVLVAEDGPSALRQAAGHGGPLHLLLTDVVMPGMSGRELADRLRETRPRVRVLFMSGHSEEVISRRGVLEPGLSFVPKPFTAQELARRLREVLAD